MKPHGLLLLATLALAACSSAPVRGTSTYTVKAGDTLYSIATRFRVDYHDLARWNRIGRDYQIYPGQILQLRSTSSSIVSAPQPRPANPVSAFVPPPASFQWTWPVTGNSFTSTTRPNGGLGLSISGREDQDIYAAAGGKVVYSGAGLLGYGQLLIIKHDDTYLSAYGYTHNILVSEGTQVSAGQKIATMGKDPAGVALLYFEIRVNGKPVDPLLFLPQQH